MKSQKDNYKKIWKENNLSYNLTLFGTKNYTSSDNFTDENKTRLQVYDKKKKAYRNVSFCDFAILSRTSTEMPAVEREMQKVGLPLIDIKILPYLPAQNVTSGFVFLKQL